MGKPLSCLTCMYLMTNLTLLAHLKCGSDSKFLYAGASTHKDHNSLTGHKRAGSSFKMEGDGSKFEILLVRTPMYLAINKDHCDRKGRPVMEVGGGESIKCKMEGNYIRIISPRQGYLGYNERENIAVFVEDKSEEERGSLWLQFEWQEPQSSIWSSIVGGVIGMWPWGFGGTAGAIGGGAAVGAGIGIAPVGNYDDPQPPPINIPNFNRK